MTPTIVQVLQEVVHPAYYIGPRAVVVHERLGVDASGQQWRYAVDVVTTPDGQMTTHPARSFTRIDDVPTLARGDIVDVEGRRGVVERRSKERLVGDVFVSQVFVSFDDTGERTWVDAIRVVKVRAHASAYERK